MGDTHLFSGAHNTIDSSLDRGTLNTADKSSGSRAQSTTDNELISGTLTPAEQAKNKKRRKEENEVLEVREAFLLSQAVMLKEWPILIGLIGAWQLFQA